MAMIASSLMSLSWARILVDGSGHGQDEVAQQLVNLQPSFAAFEGERQSGATLAQSTSFIGSLFVLGS